MADAPAGSAPPGRVATLRRLLLEHFDVHRRDLPWRRTDDPYRIWVSEVMLQQTRVETVVPYYERWLERFPDVGALAGADRDEVLGMWKGLGYYSRARNLHAAARLVRERHGGELPRAPDALKTLPGVGEYTAGAVASIAFGEAVPAVDGNVRRVLSRLFDLPDPGPARLRELAAGLVDPVRPGDFNEALMELGATVCTPASPACAQCPLHGLCLARARGTVDERPRPRRRTAVRRAVVGTAVAVAPDGRVLVVRRPEDGLLGGMEEFPGAEVEEEAPVGRSDRRPTDDSDPSRPADDDSDPPPPPAGDPDDSDPSRRAAESRLVGLGVQPAGPAERLPEVEHAFSHLRVTYRPWRIPVEGPAEPARDGSGRWVHPRSLAGANLSVAQQRIAGSLPGLPG